MYKVVQIWPGQTVTCLHTNRPGYIWNTFYMFLISLGVKLNSIFCNTKAYKISMQPLFYIMYLKYFSQESLNTFLIIDKNLLILSINNVKILTSFQAYTESKEVTVLLFKWLRLWYI
jgi:hypothetical protein